MNTLLLIIATFVLVGIEIVLSFYIKIGFILIIYILIMGAFIILKNKTLSLAVTISIFIYGIILAFMQNHSYVSKNISITNNIIIDKQSNKKFKISSSLKQNKKGYITCYYSTLFGKKLKDSGCYYVVSDKLFSITPINK